jgi:Uma2 family endonuclease
MLSIDDWLDEKPYREVYDGAIHAKVSPLSVHSILAFHIAKLLDAWGGELGDTGVEWRVHLRPGTSLVPDVAFFLRERLSTLDDEAYNKPPFAPDIAVEVRSPKDRAPNIKRKTALYLAHGSSVVLNVDPRDRSVRLSSSNREDVLRVGDVVVHPALPGLRIAVADIFTPLRGRGRT